MSSPEIAMVIPADSRFVSTARATAASLGAELDFSIDEIAELRMGANEIVALLIDVAEEHGLGTVELRYIVSDDSVEVIGMVAADEAAAVPPLSLDHLAEQIFDSVATEYRVDDTSIRLLKRRTGA